MRHFHQAQLTDHGLRLTFFDSEPVELTSWDALRLRKELQSLEYALLELFRHEQKQIEQEEKPS